MCTSRKPYLFTSLVGVTAMATALPINLHLKLSHTWERQINDFIFGTAKLYFNVPPENKIIKV